jgi:hypothetical protein
VLGSNGRVPWASVDRLGKLLGDRDPHRREDGLVCVYAAGETEARAAFEQARRLPDFDHVRLEHWDETPGDWATVDSQGDLCIAKRRWRVPWFKIGLLAVVNVLGAVSLFFAAPGEYSPGAGHVHDLGWTFEATISIDLIAGGYYLWQQRASRD